MGGTAFSAGEVMAVVPVVVAATVAVTGVAKLARISVTTMLGMEKLLQTHGRHWRDLGDERCTGGMLFICLR